MFSIKELHNLLDAVITYKDEYTLDNFAYHEYKELQEKLKN